jgi:transketolase
MGFWVARRTKRLWSDDEQTVRNRALEDLAMMRTIAGLTVVCATDAALLRSILRASLNHPGAMYIRLGRGRDTVVYDAPPPDFAFGKPFRLGEGSDLTIIATGTEVHPSLNAAEKLAARGISVRVVDMHTISPLDAEEVNITGGLGSAVAEVLVECDRLLFARHGVPYEFAPIGPPAALYAHYRLDSDGIAVRAEELLNR